MYSCRSGGAWQRTVGDGARWVTGGYNVTKTHTTGAYLPGVHRGHDRVSSDDKLSYATRDSQVRIISGSHPHTSNTLDSCAQHTSWSRTHQAFHCKAASLVTDEPGRLGLCLLRIQPSQLTQHRQSLIAISKRLFSKTENISSTENISKQLPAQREQASYCESDEPPSDSNMKKAFQLMVKTGDQEGAGTDANVYVELEDEAGLVTPRVKLDKIFYNDLERSKRDTYDVECPENFGKVVSLRVTRDTKGLADNWFCDYIHVNDNRTPKKVSMQQITKSVRNFLGSNYLKESKSKEKIVYFFPIHRWIAPKHEYFFHEYAVCLPQDDPCLGPRKSNLESKRNSYNFIVHKPGLVAQIENLPSDEKFSEEYYWTFATDKLNLLAQTKFIEWTTSKWNTLDDLKRVYRQSLGEPTCIGVWKEDWWFGLQRLQGVNPNVIRLCKKIPDNFAVTEETVKGFLGEMSLAEALEKNKMFICDLEITDGLVCKEGNYGLASPLALFHLNSENSLLPVAIQLKQKRGPDNPVYTPNDPPNTWLVAKMFYNNVEAQHHQALTHLGYTHLLMEGVVICTHRNLSPSHPLFKLMAPHFLFLLAINTRGLEKLVAPGGWVDNCMTQGVTGIFNLMKRGFDRWRFDREGQVEKELEARGVLDKTILPYYPYRDDAIPLYNVIKKYVTTVVKHHYDTPEKISGDWELRWWREELVKSRDENGVGLQNVPGTADGFTTVEEVIDVVTVIISICSLGHAAANFQQYEQYGFVPNYPGILMLDIPKEKKNYTEEEIMAMLPDKRMTLDIMVITKLLSSRGTKSLGDFEMQYLYDPVGVQAAEEFQKDLKRLSYEMKGRNIDRPWKFDWLDPEIVPNSISV
ncbi:polyunsaturated fatty acid 5-lipoxygenase-like isoform X1 [Homarus americanus]|uniref:polyunsaturated fatty acid 5-lipoxygenase-like isoform X1 n=1 Tax=Homarus americanus TaxID=6706 RepID=UPI001C4684BB|nr:polyunsaturated fatty acid 5-lipoxygenase-like isoform X1 [Homarus americanus]